MGWLAGWKKRVLITLDASDVDADLTNFPTLLYLSTESGTGNDDVSFVFDELSSDENRKKIAVTTSDGTTECYVEIEKWDDANEQAWLWVNVPSIDNDVNTELYLYYDNSHADNPYVDDTNTGNSSSVWNSNFMMVHHLVGAAAANLDDSTTNNNDVAGAVDAPAYNAVGKIASAVDFELSGTADALYVNDADTLDGFTQATWEFWFNAESLPANNSTTWNTIMNKYTTTDNQRSWAMGFYGGNADSHVCQLRFTPSVNGTSFYTYYYNWTPTLGVWYHVVITWASGGTPILYIGGTATSWTSGGNMTGTIYPGTHRLDIAGSYTAGRTWDGLLDELRILNDDMSASYAKASYQTQIDDILDWGVEEHATTAVQMNIPQPLRNINSTWFLNGLKRKMVV